MVITSWVLNFESLWFEFHSNHTSSDFMGWELLAEDWFLWCPGMFTVNLPANKQEMTPHLKLPVYWMKLSDAFQLCMPFQSYHCKDRIKPVYFGSSGTRSCSCIATTWKGKENELTCASWVSNQPATTPTIPLVMYVELGKHWKLFSWMLHVLVRM